MTSSPSPTLHHNKHRKPRTIRSVFLAGMLALVAVFILCFPLVRGGVRAGLGVRDLKTMQARMEQHLADGDIGSAQEDLLAAQSMLPEMRRQLERTGFWRWMPFLATNSEP